MVRQYYWVVVSLTALSWLFLLAKPFILCPQFGLESRMSPGPLSFPRQLPKQKRAHHSLPQSTASKSLKTASTSP